MAADKRAARLGVLALVGTLLFGAIGARLWFLQTVQAGSLQDTVDQSKVRVVPVVPERGRIFDADGRILADNDRLLTVSIDWEVMRRDTDRAELFTRLSGWLEMAVEEMEERYDSGLYSRYRPMPLKEDVDEPVAIAVEERAEDFPGVTVETDWRRTYPYSPLATHVIGYTGAITKEDADRYEELGYDISKGGEDVGRSGVELSMEEVLHGQWGQRVVEVDSRNRVVREISRTEPVSGNDIQLSIDLDLQQYAERVLQTQLQLRKQFKAPNPMIEDPLTLVVAPMDPSQGPEVPYKAPAGSVIALDQQTGQVMAMASYPTYDNRWFSADISADKFNQLFPREVDGGPPIDPDQSSLTNRAVQGQYNMGSAFKVFVAYAGLVTGLINADTTFDDQGTYKLQRVDPLDCAAGVRCEYRNSLCGDGQPCVYGVVDLALSLAVSSDAYYYKLGEDFFWSPGTLLQDSVRQFGFGADTGIDLPFEFDGRVPSDALKAELLEEGTPGFENESPTLTPGDLLQMAIGQGLMAVTPIQLAVGYAAIANGGNVVTPRVVQTIFEPEVPDGSPGFADLFAATVVETVAPPARTIAMPPDVRDPIVAGVRRNVTGPGANLRTTTAEELFEVGYPPEA
ncbi:MAG: penicillin-binding transpeptidase domain-containing protein, partial [Ilumatobacteraceae bacterium]